ncbi:hypothetical protein [Pseudomonas sp. I2]|uniref:hypothetical protein n=1 Tax=Pseudomonas sp. I2 TaxID=1338438 RepID=UPI0034D6EF15
MESEKKPSWSIPTIVFGAGLVGLATSLAGYLLHIPQTGHVFIVSLLMLLFGALVSALRREGGAKFEDVLTMIVALFFFGWLAWKAFS